MIIKNNCVIGQNSLGMISPIPIITPTRRSFVGPLLEEEDTSATRQGGSLPARRVIKCPKAVGHGGPYTYHVPVEDACYQEPNAVHRRLFMFNQDFPHNRERIGNKVLDRPWRGVPYKCPRPGGGSHA